MNPPQRLAPDMCADREGGYVAYEDYQALRRAWNTMKAAHGYRVTIDSTMNRAETIRELMNRIEKGAAL